jgi:hypothetical protein
MENEIINLYLSGNGSTNISKILGVSKKKVLKILNKNNLIIKKNNPLYDTFTFDGEKWVTTYNCEVCKNNIEIKASKKYYLYRNLKKKKKCKSCSSSGSCNNFFNKKHSNTTILKISNNRKGKCVGNKNPMSKLENRKKVSEGLKNKWDSGELETLRLKLSSLMVDKIKKGVIKGFNRSKAEDEIIKLLNDKGIDCVPSFYLGGKIFDIYVPKFNLLIEFNGDYWHCNPNKYDENYLNTKKNKTAKEIWEYDKNKLDLSNELGYINEVIWEQDYKKTPNIINEIINKYETSY